LDHLLLIFSSSIIENYQKEIAQLQESLSRKDDERTLLRDRLNEVELELRKTLDDYASKMTKYESLVAERDALVEQEALRSAER
jgi:predicted nuclease with TOPRIM domain